MISRAHEGGENYEEVIRHIAKPTRFQRRALAKTMGEAWMTAHKMPPEKGDHFRWVLFSDGVTYVFLFMDEKLGKEKSQDMLRALCIVARAVVMKICGWKDLKTMQRYIRLAGIEVCGATENLKLIRVDQASGKVFAFNILNNNKSNQ